MGQESLSPIPPHLERCLRLHAEAMAWRGGAWSDGEQRVEVTEEALREVCWDLVRTGSARLAVATGPAPSAAAGPVGSMGVDELRLVLPATGGRPPGVSRLVEAGFDAEAYAKLAEQAEVRPAARERLAGLVARLAESLLIPLVLFDPGRVDRTRPELLARGLVDFWLEIHRVRVALAETLTVEGERVLNAGSGRARRNWRYRWHADWRAECAVDEPGGWGPVYQVFHRHGIDLSPFARSFAAAAGAGRLEPEFRERQAVYFSSR